MSEITESKNQLEITWLGQAGFLFRDDKGNSLAVDVYLTDSCERLVAFKRLSPSVLKPEDLRVDVLLASHNHADHLDVDAVPVIMSNPGTILAGPGSVIKAAEDMGVDKGRLRLMKAGDKFVHKGMEIRAVYADHGTLAPDAIGFLLTIGGTKVYFAGDTAYRPEMMTEAIDFRPDLLIPPINGAYGNLDSEEAAKLARDTGAKFVMPCHFWTFREHGGNPQEFFDAMKVYAPESSPVFLTPGKVWKG